VTELREMGDLYSKQHGLKNNNNNNDNNNNNNNNNNNVEEECKLRVF